MENRYAQNIIHTGENIAHKVGFHTEHLKSGNDQETVHNESISDKTILMNPESPIIDTNILHPRDPSIGAMTLTPINEELGGAAASSSGGGSGIRGENANYSTKINESGGDNTTSTDNTQRSQQHSVEPQSTEQQSNERHAELGQRVKGSLPQHVHTEDYDINRFADESPAYKSVCYIIYTCI